MCVLGCARCPCSLCITRMWQMPNLLVINMDGVRWPNTNERRKKNYTYENGGQQMYSLNRFNWPMLSAHDDLYPNIVSTCPNCSDAGRRQNTRITHGIHFMYRCIFHTHIHGAAPHIQSGTHLCESIILNGNALTTNGQRLVRVIRSETRNDLYAPKRRE